MNAVWDWWLSLWHHGLIGPLIALVVAAFVVLAVGNVLIWTLAGLKAIGGGTAGGFSKQRRSEPEDPHKERWPGLIGED